MNKNFMLSVLFILFGVTAVSKAENAPITCAIMTYNGRYVTAVGDGGRTTDVLHTDATRIGSWEKFKFICGI